MCRAATPATSPSKTGRRPSSTTRRKTMPHRTFRWSCWAARSTAPDRRGTGPPRAPSLLGVRAVITESFERIHRSNLIGMGVIPLQFPPGESAASLKLDGTETRRHHRHRGAQRGQDPEDGARQGHQGRRQRGRVRRRGAHRHPWGGRLLPQRRHPAVRAAQHAEVRLATRHIAAAVTGVIGVGEADRRPARAPARVHHQQQGPQTAAAHPDGRRHRALRPRSRRRADRDGTTVPGRLGWRATCATPRSHSVERLYGNDGGRLRDTTARAT